MSAATKLAAFALVSLALAVVPHASAQETSSFTAAQLEQMAAPIALYPDSLLTQILMGSTYPLEIVEAHRWVQANPGVSGKNLEEALKTKEWDPAVKSLCGFPDVLKRMNENLDWTQDLGDAFLAQKSELLDAVQRMRNKAHEAGNLKTTEQQTVTTQPDKIIVIQSASPEVVYVPTYSPTVVYGAWYYPTWYYPPMYVPPPPGYGAMAFTAGVVWGAALSGNCNWGWGHSDVDIDVNHYNTFNKNTNINAEKYNVQNKSGNTGQWNHNPEHRKGVNYKNPQTAQQYGAQQGSSRVTRDQARGYDQASARGGSSAGAAGQRGGASPSTGNVGGRQSGAATREPAGQKPGATNREAGGGQPGASTRDAGTQRPSGTPSPSRSGGGQGSAWSGSKSPGMDRSASTRGASSRGGGGGGRRR